MSSRIVPLHADAKAVFAAPRPPSTPLPVACVVACCCCCFLLSLFAVWVTACCLVPRCCPCCLLRCQLPVLSPVLPAASAACCLSYRLLRPLLLPVLPPPLDADWTTHGEWSASDIIKTVHVSVCVVREVKVNLSLYDILYVRREWSCVPWRICYKGRIWRVL